MKRHTFFLYLIGFLLFSEVPLSAFEQGDFLIRARVVNVYPLDSSGTINTISGAKVGVKQGWTGELDFTYMLTENWGLEQILATSKHKIRGRKSIKSLGTIATTWLIPPTLLLQYHFCPCSKLQPYVGLGVNYTLFWNEKTTSSLSKTKIKLRHSWGLAGQLGADYILSDCWFLNVDLKYVDVDTRAKLTGGTKGKVRVDIDPLIFGIGVGRKF